MPAQKADERIACFENSQPETFATRGAGLHAGPVRRQRRDHETAPGVFDRSDADTGEQHRHPGPAHPLGDHPGHRQLPFLVFGEIRGPAGSQKM